MFSSPTKSSVLDYFRQYISDGSPDVDFEDADGSQSISSTPTPQNFQVPVPISVVAQKRKALEILFPSKENVEINACLDGVTKKKNGNPLLQHKKWISIPLLSPLSSLS